MIDRANIVVVSGAGGHGAISGRHEKYVPRGGPDGGDGGDGGSVVLIADRNVNTLRGFRYRHRFAAQAGEAGKGGLRHGRSGRDTEVTVPVGTQVFEGEGKGHLLADLDNDGQRVRIATGGVGGRGNASFATSVNQFPLLAEAGEAGTERALRLELKLIGDVGLVGLPNAGKSSLLSAISRAQPKVAPYPFTTVEPILGVVDHHGAELVVVDIPGLIAGASQGVGLGHDFLRHVERASVLVHVIDAAADNPLDDADKIGEEMAEFDPRLMDKPRIVALNKMDIPEAAARLDTLVAGCRRRGLSATGISAAGRTGLEELLDLVVEMVDEYGREGPQRQSLRERLGVQQQDVETERRATDTVEVPVIRPAPVDRRASVVVEDGVFVVRSAKAVRLAVMIDPASWPAKQQFYAQLRRMGIVRQLEGLGISTGDTVRIGDTEWEWA